MQVIHEKITIKELKKMAVKMFGDLVKAVVDIDKEILGNRSRGVDDLKIQKRIMHIVNKLVTK